jgi:hypothetical protein
MPVNPVVSDVTGAGPFDTVGVSLIPMAAPPTGITGLSAHRRLSTADTNLVSVKGSAGQLYWLYCHNVNPAVRFIKFYNKASAPVIASDAALLVLTLPIPASTAGNGFSLSLPHPVVFSTGIAFAITTGVGDTDVGAVAANEIVVNMGYR